MIRVVTKNVELGRSFLASSVVVAKQLLKVSLPQDIWEDKYAVLGLEKRYQ